MATLKIPVVIDGVKTIEELANRVLDEYEYHGRTIREWADLISKIPPHGRLIDADVLIAKCKEMQSIEWNKKASPYSWAYAYENFEDDIDDAPTIIPAEEAE